MRLYFKEQKIDLGNPADAARAVQYIHDHFGESVTLCDVTLCLWIDRDKVPWSAMNDLPNFYYMSAEQRRFFLTSTEERLHRSGWLVVDRTYAEADKWLADYDVVYQRDQKMDFGTYYAIRYVPRLGVSAK